MFTLSTVLLKGFEVSAYAWVHKNLRLVTLPWDSPFTWLLCLIVYDFCYYWFHRGAHGEAKSTMIKPLTKQTLFDRIYLVRGFGREKFHQHYFFLMVLLTARVSVFLLLTYY